MPSTLDDFYLMPGDFHFATAAVRLHTILGSCIAISLWHPQYKIGGLCHFVLPSNPLGKDRELNGRYGNDCIELFRQAAINNGTQLKDYKAKIFGGGNLGGGATATANAKGVELGDCVGQRNVTAALNFLTAEEVPIMVAHVGEFGYRKIICEVQTGRVWVKYYPKSDTPISESLTGQI